MSVSPATSSSLSSASSATSARLWHDPQSVAEEFSNLKTIYQSVPYLTYLHVPGRYYQAERLSDAQILSVLLCNQKFLAGWDEAEYWQFLELQRLFGISHDSDAVQTLMSMRKRFLSNRILYDFHATRVWELEVSRSLIVSFRSFIISLVV